MLVNNVNSMEARYRVTDVATVVMAELQRLCSGDWPTAVCAGDRNQRQTLNYLNLNTNTISMFLYVTVFLIGCIVCQQSKEAATQLKKMNLKTCTRPQTALFMVCGCDTAEDFRQALEQPTLLVPAMDFGTDGCGPRQQTPWRP
jgi:hypothetical protein